MLSRFLFSFSCFVIACSSLSSKEYVVMHSRDAGMFSVWMDVLSLVHGYENGLYNGIEVNFKKEGLYYDKDFGDNWWEYYCEPIKFGEEIDVHHVMGDPPEVPGPIEEKLSRHLVREYIEKYIRVRSDIMNEVAQYQIDNFVGNFVISIHYRGTDKLEHEAFEVPYPEVVVQVDKVIKEHAGERYKIFIATDEQKFVDFMCFRYGNAVIYRDVERSTDGRPLHFGNQNPYRQGLEALMDSILLSRGHYLIRTTSNLSRWSTFFNPDLPVYELSQMECH